MRTRYICRQLCKKIFNRIQWTTSLKVFIILFFYFNNALRCYNRMKKKNANTLHLPAVISKNIQQKPMINESKNVHITFFFSFSTTHQDVTKEWKKKWTHYICRQLCRNLYNRSPWSRSVKVFILLFFFTISTTHWGATIESKRKIVTTLHSPAVTSYNIQKNYDQGVYKCKNVHITFHFFYFNITLWCYNRI